MLTPLEELISLSATERVANELLEKRLSLKVGNRGLQSLLEIISKRKGTILDALGNRYLSSSTYEENKSKCPRFFAKILELVNSVEFSYSTSVSNILSWKNFDSASIDDDNENILEKAVRRLGKVRSSPPSIDRDTECPNISWGKFLSSMFSWGDNLFFSDADSDSVTELRNFEADLRRVCQKAGERAQNIQNSVVEILNQISTDISIPMLGERNGIPTPEWNAFVSMVEDTMFSLHKNQVYLLYWVLYKMFTGNESLTTRALFCVPATINKKTMEIELSLSGSKISDSLLRFLRIEFIKLTTPEFNVGKVTKVVGSLHESSFDRGNRMPRSRILNDKDVVKVLDDLCRMILNRTQELDKEFDVLKNELKSNLKVDLSTLKKLEDVQKEFYKVQYDFGVLDPCFARETICVLFDGVQRQLISQLEEKLRHLRRAEGDLQEDRNYVSAKGWNSIQQEEVFSSNALQTLLNQCNAGKAHTGKYAKGLDPLQNIQRLIQDQMNESWLPKLVTRERIRSTEPVLSKEEYLNLRSRNVQSMNGSKDLSARLSSNSSLPTPREVTKQEAAPFPIPAPVPAKAPVPAAAPAPAAETTKVSGPGPAATMAAGSARVPAGGSERTPALSSESFAPLRVGASSARSSQTQNASVGTVTENVLQSKGEDAELELRQETSVPESVGLQRLSVSFPTTSEGSFSRLVSPDAISRHDEHKNHLASLLNRFPFLRKEPVPGVYLEDLGSFGEQTRFRVAVNTLIAKQNSSYRYSARELQQQEEEINRIVADFADGLCQATLRAVQELPFLSVRVHRVLLAVVLPFLDGDEKFQNLLSARNRLLKELLQEDGSTHSRPDNRGQPLPRSVPTSEEIRKLERQLMDVAQEIAMHNVIPCLEQERSSKSIVLLQREVLRRMPTKGPATSISSGSPVRQSDKYLRGEDRGHPPSSSSSPSPTVMEVSPAAESRAPNRPTKAAPPSTAGTTTPAAPSPPAATVGTSLTKSSERSKGSPALAASSPSPVSSRGAAPTSVMGSQEDGMEYGQLHTQQSFPVSIAIAAPSPPHEVTASSTSLSLPSSCELTDRSPRGVLSGASSPLASPSSPRSVPGTAPRGATHPTRRIEEEAGKRMPTTSTSTSTSRTVPGPSSPSPSSPLATTSGSASSASPAFPPPLPTSSSTPSSSHDVAGFSAPSLAPAAPLHSSGGGGGNVPSTPTGYALPPPHVPPLSHTSGTAAAALPPRQTAGVSGTGEKGRGGAEPPFTPPLHPAPHHHSTSTMTPCTPPPPSTTTTSFQGGGSHGESGGTTPAAPSRSHLMTPLGAAHPTTALPQGPHRSGAVGGTEGKEDEKSPTTMHAPPSSSSAPAPGITSPRKNARGEEGEEMKKKGKYTPDPMTGNHRGGAIPAAASPLMKLSRPEEPPVLVLHSLSSSVETRGREEGKGTEGSMMEGKKRKGRRKSDVSTTGRSSSSSPGSPMVSSPRTPTMLPTESTAPRPLPAAATGPASPSTRHTFIPPPSSTLPTTTTTVSPSTAAVASWGPGPSMGGERAAPPSSTPHSLPPKERVAPGAAEEEGGERPLPTSGMAKGKQGGPLVPSTHVAVDKDQPPHQHPQKKKKSSVSSVDDVPSSLGTERGAAPQKTNSSSLPLTSTTMAQTFQGTSPSFSSGEEPVPIPEVVAVADTMTGGELPAGNIWHEGGEGVGSSNGLAAHSPSSVSDGTTGRSGATSGGASCTLPPSHVLESAPRTGSNEKEEGNTTSSGSAVEMKKRFSNDFTGLPVSRPFWYHQPPTGVAAAHAPSVHMEPQGGNDPHTSSTTVSPAPTTTTPTPAVGKRCPNGSPMNTSKSPGMGSFYLPNSLASPSALSTLQSSSNEYTHASRGSSSNSSNVSSGSGGGGKPNSSSLLQLIPSGLSSLPPCRPNPQPMAATIGTTSSGSESRVRNILSAPDIKNQWKSASYSGARHPLPHMGSLHPQDVLRPPLHSATPPPTPLSLMEPPMGTLGSSKSSSNSGSQSMRGITGIQGNNEHQIQMATSSSTTLGTNGALIPTVKGDITSGTAKEGESPSIPSRPAKKLVLGVGRAARLALISTITNRPGANRSKGEKELHEGEKNGSNTQPHTTGSGTSTRLTSKGATQGVSTTGTQRSGNPLWQRKQLSPAPLGLKSAAATKKGGGTTPSPLPSSSHDDADHDKKQEEKEPGPPRSQPDPSPLAESSSSSLATTGTGTTPSQPVRHAASLPPPHQSNSSFSSPSSFFSATTPALPPPPVTAALLNRIASPAALNAAVKQAAPQRQATTSTITSTAKHPKGTASTTTTVTLDWTDHARHGEKSTTLPPSGTSSVTTNTTRSTTPPVSTPPPPSVSSSVPSTTPTTSTTTASTTTTTASTTTTTTTTPRETVPLQKFANDPTVATALFQNSPEERDRTSTTTKKEEELNNKSTSSTNPAGPTESESMAKKRTHATSLSVKKAPTPTVALLSTLVKSVRRRRSGARQGETPTSPTTPSFGGTMGTGSARSRAISLSTPTTPTTISLSPRPAPRRATPRTPTHAAAAPLAAAAAVASTAPFPEAAAASRSPAVPPPTTAAPTTPPTASAVTPPGPPLSTASSQASLSGRASYEGKVAVLGGGKDSGSDSGGVSSGGKRPHSMTAEAPAAPTTTTTTTTTHPSTTVSTPTKSVASSTSTSVRYWHHPPDAHQTTPPMTSSSSPTASTTLIPMRSSSPRGNKPHFTVSANRLSGHDGGVGGVEGSGQRLCTVPSLLLQHKRQKEQLLQQQQLIHERQQQEVQETLRQQTEELKQRLHQGPLVNVLTAPRARRARADSSGSTSTTPPTQARAGPTGTTSTVPEEGTVEKEKASHLSPSHLVSGKQKGSALPYPAPLSTAGRYKSPVKSVPSSAMPTPFPRTPPTSSRSAPSPSSAGKHAGEGDEQVQLHTSKPMRSGRTKGVDTTPLNMTFNTSLKNSSNSSSSLFYAHLLQAQREVLQQAVLGGWSGGSSHPGSTAGGKTREGGEGVERMGSSTSIECKTPVSPRDENNASFSTIASLSQGSGAGRPFSSVKQSPSLPHGNNTQHANHNHENSSSNLLDGVPAGKAEFFRSVSGSFGSGGLPYEGGSRGGGRSSPNSGGYQVVPLSSQGEIEDLNQTSPQGRGNTSGRRLSPQMRRSCEALRQATAFARSARQRPVLSYLSSCRSLVEIYQHACKALGLRPNSVLLRTFPSSSGARLERIDMSSNYVGAKGLLPLFYVMEANGNELVHLNLSSNNLENAEVLELLEVLCGDAGENLAFLDLSYNPISQSGGQAILRLTKARPQLVSIQLKGTLIPPRLLQNIVENVEENAFRQHIGVF